VDLQACFKNDQCHGEEAIGNQHADEHRHVCVCVGVCVWYFLDTLILPSACALL